MEREVTKKKQITAGDEEPGGLQSDIYYSHVIHENFDLPDSDSEWWTVLHVQSCARALTGTHLVMGELCQKTRRKRKPRRSQRNRTQS